MSSSPPLSAAVTPDRAAVPSLPPTIADTPQAAAWRLPMLAIVGVSATYVLGQIDRGWIPSDDGMLGHAAERLLAGELPHRDFDDPYTGGLTWLHAWAFQVLGDRLSSLRLVLFAAFLAWVPVVQFIATRFLRPWPAALATALCVAWSVPNYPASMPSWYNLFLATFGVAALLRFVEVHRTRWLVIAGAAAGLSVVFKIIGVYFVAAGLLSLILLARTGDDDAPADPGRWSYPAFMTVCLAVFVLALVAVVRQALHPREVVNFVLPGGVLAAAIAWTEWSAAPRARPFRRLLRLVVPFLIGVAIPIAVFLVPFAAGGGVEDLVRGVFILPQRRLQWAYDPPLPIWTMNAAIPVFIGGWLLMRRHRPLPRAVLLAAAGVFAVALWFVGREGNSYRIVWFAVRAAPVFIVLIAAWQIGRRSEGAGIDPGRARLVIVTSALACCGLVQFPYAAPIYYFYMAPLVFVALLPWIGGGTLALRQAAGVAAAFLIGFAVLRVNGTPLQYMQRYYVAPLALQPLPSEKGGILVPDDHALLGAMLIELLQEKARGGFTWASPDAPEIYYLSGLRNPTRTMYDFFDDGPDREARVLRALDEKGVTAVALNRIPYFSPPISRSMYAALARRYPYGRQIGSFVVLWRE